MRESQVGSFSCDLTCQGPNGTRVVIENQLEKTDHDHLGKVLTYVANLDAKIAIWISTEPRAEHIRTIQWLNEITPADASFLLVKLAAYRISGSESAAPLFTVIVGSEIAESKQIGEEKKDLAGRHILRLKFWEGLLDRAKKRGVMLHAQRAPSKDLWLGAGAGVRAGVSYTYLVWMHQETGVEFYIGNEDNFENKRIFDALYSHKAEIESAFGKPLQWDRGEEQKFSRSRFVLKQGGLMEEEKWPEIQDATISAMDNLAKALKPFLSKI